MRPSPPTEFLFFVDDGEQWFEVHRCQLCGAVLDLLDQALHGEAHPEHQKEDA